MKVPDGTDPKAEKAMLVRVASQPSSGAGSYQTGADVSRYQRSTVPGKASSGEDGRPMPMMSAPQSGGGAPVVVQGPAVRVARGNAVTMVPVGGKN